MFETLKSRIGVEYLDLPGDRLSALCWGSDRAAADLSRIIAKDDVFLRNFVQISKMYETYLIRLYDIKEMIRQEEMLGLDIDYRELDVKTENKIDRLVENISRGVKAA